MKRGQRHHLWERLESIDLPGGSTSYIDRCSCGLNRIHQSYPIEDPRNDWYPGQSLKYRFETTEGDAIEKPWLCPITNPAVGSK